MHVPPLGFNYLYFKRFEDWYHTLIKSHIPVNTDKVKGREGGRGRDRQTDRQTDRERMREATNKERDVAQVE